MDPITRVDIYVLQRRGHYPVCFAKLPEAAVRDLPALLEERARRASRADEHEDARARIRPALVGNVVRGQMFVPSCGYRDADAADDAVTQRPAGRVRGAR